MAAEDKAYHRRVDEQSTAARIGRLGRRFGPSRAVLNARVRLMHARWERRFGPQDAQLLAALGGRTDLKLNIGSNTGHIDGWLSIDILRDPDGSIFRMDATGDWPFATGSAQAINSEHFLEHVTLAQARAYLREAHRVLRPGGVLRTSTPDLRGLVDTYLAGDRRDLDAHRAEGYVAADHAEMFNNYFYLWGHRHIYDAASLTRMLRDAGFDAIAPAAYGESQHPVLRGIDVHDMGALDALSFALDAVRP